MARPFAGIEDPPGEAAPPSYSTWASEISANRGTLSDPQEAPTPHLGMPEVYLRSIEPLIAVVLDRDAVA
jgi:hypothetical protein